MRKTPWTRLLLLAFVPASLGACGPPKQADDASGSSGSTSSTEPPKDGTEETKWDSTSTTPTSKPATSGTVGATEKGPGRRHDEYDKESVDLQMKKAARQVKDNCGGTKDEAGKAIGPWGKGKVQVVLQRNGHSGTVTVPSPFQGTPVGKCIQNAFTNLMFMPWAGQDATIDWDFDVVQPPPPPEPEKPTKPKK